MEKKMDTIITIVGTKDLIQDDSEYKVYDREAAINRVNDLMDDGVGYSIVFGREDQDKNKPQLADLNSRLFALVKLKKSRRAITKEDNARHKLKVEIEILNSIIGDNVGRLIKREHRIMKDNLEYYANRGQKE